MLPHQSKSSTSRQAAIDFQGKVLPARRRVFEAIVQLGRATDEDIQKLLRMNPSTQRPRRVELVRAGLVADSGVTKRAASGAQAVIWIPAEGAVYQESLFRTAPKKRSKKIGLAKAVEEIEAALPIGKRSAEVSTLLVRLREECAKAEKDSSSDVDDFLSWLWE